jgi:hypothetical protein
MIPSKKLTQIVAALIAKQGIELAAAKATRFALPPKKRAQIIAALKDNPNASAVTRLVGGVSQPTVWRIAKQTSIKLAAGQAAKGRYRTKQKAPAARHAGNYALDKQDRI